MSKKLPQIILLVLSVISFIVLAIVYLSLDDKSYNKSDIKLRLGINFIIIIMLVLWYFGKSEDEYFPSQTKHSNPVTYSTTNNRAIKPKIVGLNINDVSKPITQQAPVSASIPIAQQVVPASLPPKAVELTDLEKELNYIKSISDLITELTRQIKTTEKNKTDALTLQKQKITTLEEENKSKDTELKNLSDKLNIQSSLRALIGIKKICEDLSKTEKITSNEEIIKFITGSISLKLNELDVQTIEIPEGTELSDIPSEQIEISDQPVATENEQQKNTVARSISPCYFISSDSKKIIINKAVVSLYKFTPPPEAEAQISQT